MKVQTHVICNCHVVFLFSLMCSLNTVVHKCLQAGALVHIYTDGSVLLSHGGVEMGQGLHTKMVQVYYSRFLHSF